MSEHLSEEMQELAASIDSGISVDPTTEALEIADFYQEIYQVLEAINKAIEKKYSKTLTAGNTITAYDQLFRAVHGLIDMARLKVLAEYERLPKLSPQVESSHVQLKADPGYESDGFENHIESQNNTMSIAPPMFNDDLLTPEISQSSVISEPESPIEPTTSEPESPEPVTPEPENSMITQPTEQEELHIDRELHILENEIKNGELEEPNSPQPEEEHDIQKEDTQKEAMKLASYLEKMRSGKKLDPNMVAQINKLRNRSLMRYIMDAAGLHMKSYPWIEYIPAIDEVKRNLEDYGNDYIANLQLLTKSVYLITKLNIRSTNMMRLASIDSTLLKEIDGLETILPKLLFTELAGKISDLVPGDYNEIAHNYTSHNTSLKILLGSYYKSFIYHLLDDGKQEGTKTIRTETLLKYLFLAVSRLTSDEETQREHYHFIEMVEEILIMSVIKNENVSQLDVITSSTVKDKLKSLHNSHNNLYTFVRINSMDPNNTNLRYRISLDIARQVMFVGYDPTPVPFYQRVNNKYNLVPEIAQKIQSSEYLHPDNYLFGPFSQVFTPHQSNYDISQHDSMKPLLQSLRNGKNVCIIGYGASGSGKTSSLVYAPYEKDSQRKNGILINFCNQLQDPYKYLEVSFVELVGDITQTNPNLASQNYKVLPDSESNINYQYYKENTFAIQNREWLLENDVSEYEAGTTLGKFVVGVMDTRRDVKATTNNPVSSRSHILIFLHLKNTRDASTGPYLIICDFAGVENKFECDNPQVLTDFSNLSSSKCRNDKDQIGECKESGFQGFYDEFIAQKLHKLQEIAYTNPDEVQGKIMANIKTPVGLDRQACQHFIDTYMLSPEDLSHVEILLSQGKEIPKNLSQKLGPMELAQLIDKYQKLTKTNNVQSSPTSRAYYHPDDFLDVNSKTKDYHPLLNLWQTKVISVKGKYPKDQTVTFPKAHVGGASYNLNKYFFEVYFGINSSNSDQVNTQHYQETWNQVKEYLLTLYNIKHLRYDVELAKKELVVAQKEVYSDICQDRVKEGQFINDSLAELRQFVSYFITQLQSQGKNHSTFSPKFIDICAPIQCNPYYEDCFGSNDQNSFDEPKSAIINQMRQKICGGETTDCDSFRDLVFCVFNVINLTPSANNPPPVPYIDVSDLTRELNRLESLSTLYNEPYNTEEEYEARIADDSLSPLVFPGYLQSLLDCPLISTDTEVSGKLSTVISQQIVRAVIQLMEETRDINITITYLKQLLHLINTTNSISLIGTLSYTDIISKFGLNRSICNFSYKDKKVEKTGQNLQTNLNILAKYKKYITYIRDTKYGQSIFAK